MNPHSRLMKFLLSLGFQKLAWACRRLYCPVPSSALVLEVGSGGSPYFRANVLIDAYEETRERHWVPFIKDRPTVLGLGEALPFKDKAFDFVIASHVLEHSSDPERFLSEMQRVAKAGYIETPDALMERLNPYWDHRCEVTVIDGVLNIRKKSDWKTDPDLVALYEARAKPLIAGKVIPANPFVFHTRFYWSDEIPFQIVNPDVDASWTAPNADYTTFPANTFRADFGQAVLSLARRILSQKRRNQSLDLRSIMQCPACRSPALDVEATQAVCSDCGQEFKVMAGV